MADPASILLQAAHQVGWQPPEGDADAIARWCIEQLRVIQGGQDREHAKNAIHSAVEAAQQGNVEYAVAGLRVAHDATKPH